MSRHPRALVVVLAAFVALLGGCRLDVDVALHVGADGTGEVVVTAAVDADVVQQVPGLAEDLRFDDAEAAGWSVEGPTAGDDGGLRVVLRHPVTSAQEATNLLASLGPPFVDVRVERTVDDDDVTTMLSGRLQLSDGFATFADSDLLSAVGGPPFADELDAAAASPAQSMSVAFRAEVAGEIETTTGTERNGGLVWDAPLDGTATDLATTAVQRPHRGAAWAGPLSWLALALLVVWVVGAAALIIHVAGVRHRRSQRRTAR